MFRIQIDCIVQCTLSIACDYPTKSNYKYEAITDLTNRKRTVITSGSLQARHTIGNGERGSGRDRMLVVLRKRGR